MHESTHYRRIRNLEKAGVIRRYARAMYITEAYSQQTLSQKLSPDSYISFGNVLADAMVIGSIPKFQIDAVKLGRSTTFSRHGTTIRYFGVSSHLFFGFECKKGINTVFPEKALLDVLHFYQHGTRFFFDIFSGMDISKLNSNRLETFISQYINPKFKRFARDFLYENT